MSGIGLRALIRSIGFNRAANREASCAHRCDRCRAEAIAVRLAGPIDYAAFVRDIQVRAEGLDGWRK